MKNILYKIILTLTVAVMVIGCLSSCTNKLAKAKDTFDNNKKEAAEYCADKFPVKTEYIKGDSVLVLDTLYVGENVFDTVTVETKDTVYRTITKTLPAKVITKTITVTDTIVKENTAKADYLFLSLAEKEKQLVVLQSQFSDMKDSRNKFRLWFWILVGAVGAFTFLKLKKII